METQKYCSIDEIISKYGEPIFKFCLKRLSNRGEAEDLAQDILVEIVKGLRRQPTITSTNGWVWTVARNQYARRIQKMQLYSREVLTGDWYSLDTISEKDGMESILAEEEADRIFKALGSLSALYRDILVQFYIHEKTYQEIAELLSIPMTTVKWRIYQGKSRLRERMTDIMADKLRIYEPIELTIACNGSIDHNKYLDSQLARGIVMTAYEKPLTVDEINSATGIPCLYIEDELQRLLYGEAVAREGNKYAANFIILKLSDHKRMTEKFKPLAARVADRVYGKLADAEPAIRSIGFYGSDFGIERLLWVLAPIALRKSVSIIQDGNEKLSYGPYPKRRDGGSGWFIVKEGTAGSYSDDSGCNNYYIDNGNYRIQYYWIMRYFSQELNRSLKSLAWNDNGAAVKVMARGVMDGPALGDEMLAQMIGQNLIEKADGAYKSRIPALTEEQDNALTGLLEPVSLELTSMLDSLVEDIWSEFRRIVPVRLHDQVNQYIAGYVNSIIGMVVEILEERGVMERPAGDGVHTSSLMIVYNGGSLKGC